MLDTERLDILWTERNERAGVVKFLGGGVRFLRVAQVLLAIAVSLLTLSLAVKGIL